jgi:tetratricopeptide (TPR) repeat protein
VILAAIGMPNLLPEERRTSLTGEVRGLLGDRSSDSLHDSIIGLLLEDRAPLGTDTTRHITEVVGRLDRVKINFPEISRLVEVRLLSWHAQLVRSNPPLDDLAVRRVIATADTVVDALRDGHDFLVEESLSTKNAWIEVLKARPQLQGAIELLEKVGSRDGEIAWCHERLSQFAAAAVAYRRAGMAAEAAGNLCRVTDLAEAIEIARDSTDIQSLWVEELIASGNHRRALEVLVEFDGPAEQMGTCHEILGQFRDAADCFERIGRLRDAVRCLREVPDPYRALVLAERGATGDEAVLKRIIAVKELLDHGDEPADHALTRAEREMLVLLIQRRDPESPG